MKDFIFLIYKYNSIKSKYDNFKNLINNFKILPEFKLLINLNK